MTSRNETPTDELPGNSWGISGNYRDYCDSNILGVLETVTKTVICNLVRIEVGNCELSFN